MPDAHDQITAALKTIVLPQLRELGFTGSLPHFRRFRPNAIDLLTFQFDRNGGGFILEIGQCPPDGLTTPWGEHVDPKKMKAFYLRHDQRVRIQPYQGSGTESWFRYDTAASPDDFARVAETVLQFLPQAEKYFQDPNSFHRPAK